MKIQIEKVVKRECTRQEKGAVLITLNVTTEFREKVLSGDKALRSYRAALAIAVRKTIPELAGYRLTWSRKAGCTCPCTPGFVVSKNGQKTHDRYYVTVTVGEDAK